MEGWKEGRKINVKVERKREGKMEWKECENVGQSEARERKYVVGKESVKN